MGYKHLIVSYSLVTLNQTILADSQTDKERAYTNPAKPLKMPSGWEAKPARYAEKPKYVDPLIYIGQEAYPALHKLALIPPQQ